MLYLILFFATVDFYKYTDKNGKKVHVGVHIPKCIINENGEIDREKYIKLIKEYYHAPQLLDDKGSIKEYYFRMRVYANELVYDTNNQTILKFNIGSIAKKQLEWKQIYIFSYEDLYSRVYFYKKALAEEFDFKMNKVNPDGKKHFSEYKINEIIDYAIDNLMAIDDVSRYSDAIENYLSKITNYQEFLEYMAFLDLIVNRRCTWPKITGQYCPRINTVANSSGDVEYIKIKSSILGIRYVYNENGKLMISGPRQFSGMYSKIKKEKFSWKLDDDVL